MANAKPPVTILETEQRAYERHRNDLLASDEGKFVLIRADKVIGTFDTEGDAIAEGYRLFGNVPFLVKKIERVENPIIYFTTL